MRRIPELDGLRALAAAAVLLFHLDPPRFFWGWTGVDLFFVLSGYLITGIIAREVGSARSMAVFYLRRGLRIWPVYYVTLGLLVAINPLLILPEPLATVPYYLTFTQNVQLYVKSTIPPVMPAFDHTWTLALEEQFYLVWPLLAALAGKRRLAWLCLGVAMLGWMARAGGYLSWSSYSERTLLGRCDGFALGGLLAALMADGRIGEARRRWIFGATTILAGIYLASGMARLGGIPFLGLPTPADPAGTILAVGVFYLGVVGTVAASAGARWLAPLRDRRLVALGKVSYGIYMYHYPIYWLVDGGRFTNGRPWYVGVLKVALTLMAAALSWRLMERPCLNLKERLAYRATMVDKRGV